MSGVSTEAEYPSEEVMCNCGPRIDITQQELQNLARSVVYSIKELKERVRVLERYNEREGWLKKDVTRTR